MGWKCSSKGKGHDREWSLDRAGYGGAGGRGWKEGKHRNNPSIPDFSPQFNNNKVKAACVTAFF